MATRIQLKHKETGILQTGFYGFSWTTLFFGFFPALFRGDFLTFLGTFAVIVVLASVTFGVGAFIAMLVWAFLYNRYYTRNLIERGYQLNGTEEENRAAALALSISR